MTEGLQCNKDLLGTTATKWSPTVAAATATCSSRFGFFAQTRIQKNFIRCFVPIHFLCLFGRVVCFVVMSLPRSKKTGSRQSNCASMSTENPLEFWKVKKEYRRLHSLAQSHFCAPATTAGVERLFSISGHILSSRRL